MVARHSWRKSEKAEARQSPRGAPPPTDSPDIVKFLLEQEIHPVRQA